MGGSTTTLSLSSKPNLLQHISGEHPNQKSIKLEDQGTELTQSMSIDRKEEKENKHRTSSSLLYDAQELQPQMLPDQSAP